VASTARAPLGARGLSIVLFSLYALAQIGAAISGWFEFADQQRQHGQPLEVFGDNGYVWTFLEQTLQNWQSEFIALTLIVALTAVLIHRGSKHSRDGQDEAKQRIERIQQRVDALVKGQGG